MDLIFKHCSYCLIPVKSTPQCHLKNFVNLGCLYYGIFSPLKPFELSTLIIQRKVQVWFHGIFFIIHLSQLANQRCIAVLYYFLTDILQYWIQFKQTELHPSLRLDLYSPNTGHIRNSLIVQFTLPPCTEFQQYPGK